MIHQFIFAGPRPNLPASAFQAYWLHFHAMDYARKIPQIKRYLVAPRLPVKLGRDLPFFEGAAEIWLQDEAAQLASLRSPEFLNGARADEPRWAAYWQTIALDTESYILVDESKSASLVKLYVLLKRRAELPLESFRESLLQWSVDDRPPGQRRRCVGLARDALYGLGEPRFDAVDVISFDDLQTLEAACSARALVNDASLYSGLIDPRYFFVMAAQENWIIGPAER